MQGACVIEHDFPLQIIASKCVLVEWCTRFDIPDDTHNDTAFKRATSPRFAASVEMGLAKILMSAKNGREIEHEWKE